jgi:hypothetical protein
VSKDVEPGKIVVGVPAREVSTIKKMLQKKCNAFDEKDWMNNFE